MIVVGGGPCGMPIATLLGEKSIEVTLIEASDRLGGAWSSTSFEGTPVEHANRALFDNYTLTKHLFHKIGVSWSSDLFKHHKVLNAIWPIINEFQIWEIGVLLVAKVFHMLWGFGEHISVATFCQRMGFTTRSCRAFMGLTTGVISGAGS